MNDKPLLTNNNLIIRPKDVIDVSDLKERGEQLKEAIFKAVKDTQSVLVQELPNVLVMTATQYIDQDGTGQMPSYKERDRIYITPINAMDVIVKDPYNLPVNEE